jgi:hypothetical protein
MLRNDAAQLQRVVDGKAPDLGAKAFGPELIRHLTWAADVLEDENLPE